MVPGVNLKERYRIGPYPLAHNGMGEVWPGQDTLLQRPVIVKVLPPTHDADSVRRFRREALLTAQLNHPGVPKIFDLDQHNGRPYLVLERVDGVTLADLVAEQESVPIAWVVTIGAQISAVLIAARALGLVHRDIKPSNVMLEPTGAVKVLDFGLAAIHGNDRYSRITESGQSLGTIGYMAPEQINAQPTDHRTDLYGLGGTLFHLLTGQPPFVGETTATTLRHQLTDPPPRPGTLRQDVPPPLDDLIHSLLAVDPARRPPNAAEVYTALSPLIQPLPPIPGVIVEGDNAVCAYAAAVAGLAPAAAHRAALPRPRPVEQSADNAEQLLAAGEIRAAARLWRQLADQYEQLHGETHPQVLDWRRRAARAHLLMGERNRALRQLDALLAQWTSILGPDDPTVRDLQQEILRVRSEQVASG